MYPEIKKGCGTALVPMHIQIFTITIKRWERKYLVISQVVKLMFL